MASFLSRPSSSSVCNLVGKLASRLSCRAFHMGHGLQPRPSQDLSEWFSGVFSSQARTPPPDSIADLMNMIYVNAPRNSVTPFNLFCRTSMDRWMIKALRIGTKAPGPSGRSVVVVSGTQASERVPIGVSLYVAAALSQRPIEGVEVTVFPVMKPREYEMQWRSEQMNQTVKHHLIVPPAIPTHPAFKIAAEDHEYGLEGPLRSYVMKRCTNYVDVEMNLNNSATSTAHLKANSLARPLQRADVFMSSMHTHADVSASSEPAHAGFAPPRLAGPGESTLFGKLIGPPAVVIELRDRQKTLDEDEISVCGEQVLSAIRTLVEDTTGPRGFIL